MVKFFTSPEVCAIPILQILECVSLSVEYEQEEEYQERKEEFHSSQSSGQIAQTQQNQQEIKDDV